MSTSHPDLATFNLDLELQHEHALDDSGINLDDDSKFVADLQQHMQSSFMQVPAGVR